MKGMPALAEEMHISRDIFLATYHQAPVHITSISTAGSVALIKKAKKDGLQISCDVAAHHLVFTEELLNDFDSNYKIKPPLRGKSDIKALLAGLKDGTIDAISHSTVRMNLNLRMWNLRSQLTELSLNDSIAFIGESWLDASQIVEKLSINPRKLLKLPVPVIAAGENANFVLFGLTEKWQYNSTNNFSKSRNTPLLNQTLTGKVQLVYNNNQFQVYG